MTNAIDFLSVRRMTMERSYDLRVEMVDSDGFYRRADYGTFKVGPGPDYLIEVGNFSSDDNWFVRDAFEKSASWGFAAGDTSKVHQECVGTLMGGAGW